MTVLVFSLLFLSAVGIEGVSLVKKADSIIDVTIDCGANQPANTPVIKILTDVDISAVAKCKNGEKTFISTDSVHYTLPATLRARDNLCELIEKEGSENFDIEVIVHYGEADSLILTKTKLVTVVCTYNSHGKDDSPQHTVRDGPLAPIAIQTFVGGTVPASDLTLSIQTVDGQDAVGTIAFDRRYSLFGTYTGSVPNVGLKPVSCDAISNDGERYTVLTVGCGDGFIFDRTDGFVTTGTTFRSPYFFAFHLADSGNLAFDCNVTLCSGSCGGTSCETVCGTVNSFPITNGQLGTCTGNEKLGDTCTFICDEGYTKSGDGISTCGADGIWRLPQIVCTGTEETVVEPGKENVVEPGKENVVEPGKETVVEPGKENVVEPGKENVVEPAGTETAEEPAGTETAVEPGKETAVEPGKETAVEPGKETAVEPGKETVVEPGKETVVEPGTETAVEPDKETAVEPGKETVVEPGKETVVEPGKETAVEPGKETVVEPGKETAVEPGKETAVEPGKETVVEPGKETVVEPGKETVVEPGKETAVEPGKETAVEPGKETAVEPDNENVVESETEKVDCRSGPSKYPHYVVLGSITGDSDSGTVELTCAEGYLPGKETLSCVAGVWDKLEIICELAILCLIEPHPLQLPKFTILHHASGVADGSRGLGEIECTEGFTPVAGDSFIYCTDGVWSITNPLICESKTNTGDCQTPPPKLPEFTRLVNINGNDEKSTATLECEDGYISEENQELICVKGVWPELTVVCKNICLDGVAFRPHSDKTKFWQCSNGVAYPMHCPPGLIWFQELLLCNYDNK